MSHNNRVFVTTYALLVVVPLIALLAILRYGQKLAAPVSAAGVRTPHLGMPPLMPNLFILVLQIAAIVGVSRLVGNLFRRIRQPRVVGEMFAGILLGPSMLGWAAPQVSAYLFPASSLGYLNALSQLGLIIFMFLVGMNINPAELKEQGRAAVLTSHVSITAPFLLAGALAVYLYPRMADRSVSFTAFALFMGAAMSVTAFPVLARILTERNMLQSRLGSVSIACAAVDDATGWCILAYIVVLVRNQGTGTPLWLTFSGIAVFGLLMIFGVKWFVQRFQAMYKERGQLTEGALALILLLVLVSALCTEWLGIHLLFGSFLMGAIMPKGHRFVRYVLDRFETITVTLLLPLFFAFTGLRTSVRMVQGREMWTYCALIILVAIVGKVGGSMTASALAGMPVREAAGLGLLMNTRGLMGLVILDIGLDIKVISPALFSMMVIMAFATTFMTTPLLEWVCPNRAPAEAPATVPRGLSQSSLASSSSGSSRA